MVGPIALPHTPFQVFDIKRLVLKSSGTDLVMAVLVIRLECSAISRAVPDNYDINKHDFDLVVHLEYLVSSGA